MVLPNNSKFQDWYEKWAGCGEGYLVSKHTLIAPVSKIISWLFYWWGKPEYMVKTTDLPQGTDTHCIT